MKRVLPKELCIDAYSIALRTGDIAYLIRGENIKQISIHAQATLAFEFPYLLRLMNDDPKEETLDDVIISLNEMVRKADAKVGCPFKAVSFHGELTETSDNILQWEMIVDV